MQNLQHATSDPQEIGLLLVPSVTRYIVSHLQAVLVCIFWVLAILPVCCWLLSSFKSLNGVAEAGGRPPGLGLGWRAQLSVWAQGISLKLEHSLMADQNHSPSSHLWEKSSGKFLSRNGSWKKVVWWRKCLWELWNRLLSCRLTNKRVRSRNLSVTTAADWLNKH